MKNKKNASFSSQNLSSYEQEIEDALDAKKTPSLHSDRRADVQAAMDRTARKIRGGVRAGAGRKKKHFIPTSLNLTPEARAILEKKATGSTSMSQVVSQLLLENP